MAITQGLCNSFKLELLSMSTHDMDDVYKIALFTSSSTLNKSTTVYSTSNEVSGPGYTAGGIELSGLSIVLDSDTAILDWSVDPIWPASTITARGALIYNSSKSNKAVAVLDFASDINTTSGTFTVVLPTPAATTALIRLV